MAAKKKTDPFVRCFEVSEPRLHEKGHTIYKVTLKTIKVNAPDEDVLETVLWKRYNDFKKLYKAMFTLHKALHRAEEFPPFARAKLFGRFDDQVITERQQSAQDLLNFVGQRHYLVNSPVFKQFLEGGELVTVNPHSDPVLEPLRLGPEDTVSLGSDSDLSSVTSSTDQAGHDALRLSEPMEPNRDDPVQDLGGVWQYRQTADNISLDDEDPDLTEEGTLSTLTGPLPDTDMAMFDPMRVPQGSADSASGAFSNLWLLSALSELQDGEGVSSVPSTSGSEGAGCPQGLDVETAVSDSDITMGKAGSKGLPGKRSEGVGAETSGEPLPTVSQTVDLGPSLVSLPSFDLPEPPSDLLDSGSKGSTKTESLDEFDPFKPTTGSAKVSCGHGDADFKLTSDVRPDSSTTPEDPPSSHPPGDSSSTTSASVIGLSPQHAGAKPGPTTKDGRGSKPSSAGSSPSKSPRKQFMQVELGEKGKYIVDAARQISLAQQCEANANYHMAFTYYKNCVGTLLTGVQGDDNAGRREVVRRKTARYLMKAEDIYNRHLVGAKGPAADDNRWDTGQSPTQELTQELDPHVALLQGPVSELASYRVLGVIDHVLLVMDQNTNATYIMKILHKNMPRHTATTNIVPCTCPYMVRLHRFYETETALYLVLQHATGGKLWNYVSGFLNQQQEQLGDDVFSSGDDPAGPTTGNVYSGQYLHKSPTVKELASHTGEQVPSAQNSPEEGAVTDEQLTDRSESPSNCEQVVDVGEMSERGEGEGSSLGDADLTAPAETTQSYMDLLTKGHECPENGESAPNKTIQMLKDDEERFNPLPKSPKQEDTESRRDSDFLSLDGSQDALSLHRTLSKTYSASSDDTSGIDVYYVAKENKGESIEHFGDLLMRSHNKPSLENFSINSFDSDSAPGSRFDSTASDYNIESIPEVSETSPQHSDKLVVGPSPTAEEVFLLTGEHGSELVTSDSMGQLAKNRMGNLNMKPLVIVSNKQEDDAIGNGEADGMVTSTPVKKNVMDSPPEDVVKTRRDPILGLEVAPKGPDSTSFTGSFEEPSIYDLHNKGTGGDFTDSSIGTNLSAELDVPPEEQSGRRSPLLPDPRSPTEDETQTITAQQSKNGISKTSAVGYKSTQKDVTDSKMESQMKGSLKTQSSSTSPTKDVQSPTKVTSPTATTDRQRPLLRHISGERSLETGSSSHRARKRTLSGVFGELDLADEGEREKMHLPEGCVRQWAAEMVTAIAALHKMGIVCRDLRPDNVLLGDRGHILLTYFSQWKCVRGTVDPTAPVGLYSAPEVSSVFEVSAACDWWSVGVLLFELLTGKSLVSCYPGGITSHTTLVIPEHVSPEAQSLLYELLRFNPTERLGSGINGADDIRHHPFFAAVNWADLRG